MTVPNNSYERIFRRHVEDPLWAPFKFPLTVGEQSRLANKLKLRFAQLAQSFEETSLKLKYGGASAQLKDKIMRDVSLAAQELLPETAFLRHPSYPGVSCRYRSGYGFTVVIKSWLYEEGDRPKERFKAMKYFHLGHRLEKVVNRERELVKLVGQGAPANSRKQEITDNESETPECF